MSGNPDAGSGILLHSYRRCPYAMRVRMTLEEKGIPYRVFEENLNELSETVLKHHSEGRVPLLVHETAPGKVVILPESAVITEYLDEVFPERQLMPESAESKAEVRLWTRWCDAAFKPDLDAYKYELAELDENARSELLTRLNGHYAKLESVVTSHEFLLGSELTLADIHVFPFFRQMTRVKPEFTDLAKFPGASAWLQRLTSRPSFERVMAKPASSVSRTV